MLLGLAQFVLILAMLQPVDWGWQVLGILGTTSGTALFISVCAVSAMSKVRRTRLVNVVSLIAAVTVLGSAIGWASLGGGPLLFDGAHAPWIWVIIVGDAWFTGWALVLAFDGQPVRAPGIGVLAAFLTLRTAVEWFFFLPILMPTTVPAEPTGPDSTGGTVLLFAAVMLGGYILIAGWTLALGRQLVARSPRQSEAPPSTT